MKIKRLADWAQGPKIVGVIATREDLMIALRNPHIADIFEWRVDCLYGSWVTRLIKRLKKPLILTVRDPREGGKRIVWDHKRREQLIRKYMQFAAFVDIEAFNAIRLYKLICDIKSVGIRVIISCHSIDPLPFKFIQPNLRWAVEVRDAVRDDILKVALHIVRSADMDDLESWAKPIFARSETYGRFTPMAVGKKFGKSSRLKFAGYGAMLVYTYIGSAVVDGQWHAEEMLQLLRKLKLRK
jgi:3-dehydroquinate dehydratase type I